MKLNSSWGPATVLVVVVAIIVVLVGGITVVLGTYDDDFVQWARTLVDLAIAAGLLGIGRGILKSRR
jgi:intracellular septation protein A